MFFIPCWSLHVKREAQTGTARHEVTNISKETPVIEEKKEEPKDNGIDILGFDN